MTQDEDASFVTRWPLGTYGDKERRKPAACAVWGRPAGVRLFGTNGHRAQKGVQKAGREPARSARAGDRDSRPGDVALGDGSEGSSLPIFAPEQERRANRVFVHERNPCLCSFTCNVQHR